MPDSPARSQKEIFLAASEITEAAGRARFLDETCAGDADLRARVEALLQTNAPAEFLSTPPLVAVLPESGESIGYFGDYILLSEIARGSTGVVFRARQTSLNRIVALKMLRDRAHLASPDDERRFRAEAEAAAGLDHPGIVPIYEVGQHEGQGYFSMKFIDGGTLLMRAGEFRVPRRAAALMAQVARAVQHAHARGILHRDLKPGNILLDRDGAPRVVDFGIARHIGVDSGLTHTGQIVGTPHYMAPEQARGENRGLTPAADIYSLGAIFYELLAGRKAFAGDTMLTLLRQVTEQAPAPLHLRDRDLENVVLRCLEKAPADRYGSAADFADDLERWLRGEAVKARPVGVGVRFVKWARRRPAHAALAVVGLAGLVSAVVSLAPDAPPVSHPATPYAAVLEKDDARPARRAIEWFHSVHGPRGHITLRGSADQILRVHRGEPLPAGDFEIIALWLDHWNSPTELDFKSPVIDPAEFRQHAATLKKLRHCFLRSLDLGADDFAFLAQNPELTDLTVENCGGGDRLIAHVAKLRQLLHLKLSRVSGDGTPLTGRNLDTLASLPNLQTAHFVVSAVDDAAVATLMERGVQLRKICLTQTRITDAALGSLSRRALDELILDSNPGITDAGLEQLARIPSLSQLDIIDAKNLTDAGVAAFQQAHPECKIER